MKRAEKHKELPEWVRVILGGLLTFLVNIASTLLAVLLTMIEFGVIAVALYLIYLAGSAILGG